MILAAFQHTVVHKLKNVCYHELLMMWGRHLDTSFLEGSFGRVGGRVGHRVSSVVPEFMCIAEVSGKKSIM